MICSLKDLDACVSWMSRNGYTRHERRPLDRVPACSIGYGGFEIVCWSNIDPWKLLAESNRFSEPHQLLTFGHGAVVAPWVVEEILRLEINERLT